MIRLFLSPDQIAGDLARIDGSAHLHLARVLRARPGETLLLLDNQGNAFQSIIVTVERAETTARIVERVPAPPEPPIFVTVAQALGKGDKFEQVVQHGTEAGASAFVPVRAERCMVDIPAARISDRLARWRQIAQGAAEQSGRGRIPDLAEPVSFTNLMRQAPAHDACLLLHPCEVEASRLGAILAGLKMPRRLLLVVGPEGGWSPAEIAAAQMACMNVVALGPRVLRTETAALVAISQIFYHYDNT